LPASFRRHVIFPAAPDEVLAAITSHEFLLARHLPQGRAARPRDQSRDARRLVQVVEVDEYPRTLTGTDRSKTEPAVTTYEWDLEARRCRWHYRGPHGGRVRIGGEFRLGPDAGGCALDSEFQVTVDFPLVGRLIEKRVLAELEADVAGFDRRVREALGRR
jgi:hypothetical protein